MSYNAIKAGKLQDYYCNSLGMWVEVWELNNDIFQCYWLPKHISDFPSTITKFK